MPTNIFGNSSSSHDGGNKIDISLFARKPYLRPNYIEANIEEDKDLKFNLDSKTYWILYQLEKLLLKIILRN